jgi:UDP-3-O-[3-hydroxymyristoyl] glucosamine N-acyltransferase
MDTATMTETTGTPPETAPAPDGAARPALMTAGELAALLSGELRGNAAAPISGLAPIDRAHPGDLTFIRSPKYAAMWERSKATVAVMARDVAPPANIGEGRALIGVVDADAAQFLILSRLAPPPAAPTPGIDPTARVDPNASIDPSAHVGPYCVIEAGARIGARTDLVCSAYIGADASIGIDCSIGPNVSVLSACQIGNHCVISAGAVIGADGFGYSLQSHPSGRGKFLVHIPHIGNVVLGDHVDVGAGSCIDRAKFGSTFIGSGTKIDNLVQIGHNCRIGKSCVLCGHVGLSGSVTLGDGVQLAGKVGVADNISIGSMARVGANSGVMNDIPPGQTWLGLPAMPAKEAARSMALFRRLSSILKKVKLDQE